LRFEGPKLVISSNACFDNPLLWERLPHGKITVK